MANKRYSVKKIKKRDLKKLRIQKMANCRRSLSNLENIDPNPISNLENIGRELDTRKFSNYTSNEIDNENNGEMTTQKPVFTYMENVRKDSEQDRHLDREISNDQLQSMNHASYEPRVYLPQKKISTENKKLKIQGNILNDSRERLIIDKYYFFEKLKIIANHAPHFGCTLSNLHITGETKIGLNSKLKLSCDMCNSSFLINTSDPQPTQNLDINTAAVSSITNAGIGLEQFQGLCAAMNLPTLTQHMYYKKHRDICEHWEKTAYNVMASAAEREKQAAIQEGRVKNGIAVIDVIADGCWSKRSYKNNYTSLSGAAAIVGRKFREVLFLGVKNKYCCICTRAVNKGITPKTHKCFKNYSGSSSGMEAEIIAEGFKNSIDMYNIIYGRVIADGDSSTYSRILEERPYKDITVEKIECRNHILRNMCNKLVSVSKDTKYPLQMRKILTTQRILAIRKVIFSAIKKRKNDTAELGLKINNLYIDISNSYNHAFGHHNDCLGHYCCSEKKNEDLLSKLKGSAFLAKIQYIVGIVASHSRSLINDCDSNAVEQFNSIIAKFVGGKRTNLVQRETYQSRCAAAVVSFNTKMPLYNLQKSLLGNSPKSKTKQFELKRLQRNKVRHDKGKNIKINRKINFNLKSTTTVVVDKNYGTDSCQKPDMEKDIYKLAKQSFLANLKKNDIERSHIERSTILQRDSYEWLELRRNLLTASNFGKIIKRRPTTSASIVKALLYKRDMSNVTSIKHGIDNEAIALNQLATQEGVKIIHCGLFIDNEIPFLGATPDGLIGDDTIVEIKCPLSAHRMSIKEAIDNKKINFWTIRDDKLIINKNHIWYYQIQGQLHISKRNVCFLAVWFGEHEQMSVEKIFRDDDFWERKMVGKLTEFYMDHILPELIDPRQTRNMELRKPTIPEKRKQTKSIDTGPSKLIRFTDVRKTEKNVLSINEY